MTSGLTSQGEGAKGSQGVGLGILRNLKRGRGGESHCEGLRAPEIIAKEEHSGRLQSAIV